LLHTDAYRGTAYIQFVYKYTGTGCVSGGQLK
jgi:hypothetical protein